MINENFPLPLIVRFIDGEQWELTEPFEYHSKKGDIIKVPVNFVSDFASIPHIVQPIIGDPTGRYGPSAIIHDFLYYTKKYTRRKADAIFLEAMKVLGVPWWKRRIMWLAVRLVAWIPWNKRKPFLPVSARHLLACIVALFLLTSCAVLDVTYDSQGRVDKVWSTGVQDTEIIQVKDGVTTTIKRKAAIQLWPENLFTIYKD